MKRYNPRVDSARKKHRLPAWAVTPTFILGVVIVVIALTIPRVRRIIAQRRADREEDEA